MNTTTAQTRTNTVKPLNADQYTSDQLKQAMENADLADKVDSVIDQLKLNAFNITMLAAAKLNAAGVNSGEVYRVHKELDGWLDTLRRCICGDRIEVNGSITRIHKRPKVDSAD